MQTEEYLGKGVKKDKKNHGQGILSMIDIMYQIIMSKKIKEEIIS